VAHDPRTDVQAGVKLIEKAGVIAELRLATETLLQTIYIPEEITVYASSFAYNGGPLPEEGFLVIERFKDGVTDGLDVVILKINPVLNELEKSALSKVPKSQWAQNVGTDPGCGDSLTATLAFAIGVTLCLAIACAFAQPLAFRPENCYGLEKKQF
jgi:hypothetical protein